SLRDLFDKLQKCERSELPKEGIKELIIDKISDFLKSFHSFDDLPLHMLL
ncbi:11840_t:CDS:1, partial [Dentiscutata heterogama]